MMRAAQMIRPEPYQETGIIEPASDYPVWDAQETAGFSFTIAEPTVGWLPYTHVVRLMDEDSELFGYALATLDDVDMTIPEIVTTYDLNEYYGAQLRTVAGTDKLPARKSGKSWLIRRSAFEHYQKTAKVGRPKTA